VRWDVNVNIKFKASHYRGQIIIIIVVTRTPKCSCPFSNLKSNTTIMNLPIYTGCPRRNVPNFGRVFLMLNCTDITQYTYIQS